MLHSNMFQRETINVIFIRDTCEMSVHVFTRRQMTDAGSKCFGMAKELVENVTKVFKDTASKLKAVFKSETVDAVPSGIWQLQ